MDKFWCEVDLQKLLENIAILNNINDKKTIAVVKGNAYGLGIEEITNFLQDKVDMFAVYSIKEADKIKVYKDILILSPDIEYDRLKDLKKNYILSIGNLEVLEKFHKDSNYRCHIYVDTGMNRLGIKPEDVKYYVNYIKENFSNVKLEGIYTHLHNSSKINYTKRQIINFKNSIESVKSQFKYIHCLSSNSIINKEYREIAKFTNTVRVGNILYGYSGMSFGFKPIYSMYCKIMYDYYVDRGESIGYGNLYRTKRKTKVGVVNIGTIDNVGVIRQRRQNFVIHILKTVYKYFFKSSYIYYNNKKLHIIGNPSMNYTLVDITGIDYKKSHKLKVNICPTICDTSLRKKYIS